MYRQASLNVKLMLPAFLTFLLLFLLLPLLTPNAKAATLTPIIWSGGTQAAQILTDCEVTVTGIVTLTGELACSGEVVFTGGGTLQRGSAYTGRLITVNGSLEFDYITIDGNGGAVTASSAAIYVDGSGTLIMENNSVIENCVDSGGSSGGAVNLDVGAHFSMNDGEVKNNKSSSYGGAIYIGGASNQLDPAVFTMNGGYITGNSLTTVSTTYGGGAIYNRGTCIINGGEISGNDAGSRGGGIYNSSYGFLYIVDGTIKNNIATTGSGIFHSAVTPTPMGALLEIKDNADIQDIIYLDMNNQSKYIVFSTSIRNDLILTVADPSEGRVVGQGIADYSLTKVDMQKISIVPAGSWYAKLDATGNKFVLTQTDPGYGSYCYVLYDANAGSGVVEDHTDYNTGDPVTVQGAGSLARSGYVFTGWNTQADGNGTPYAPGSTFSITANVTLYAIWEVQQTITPPTYSTTPKSGESVVLVDGRETGAGEVSVADGKTTVSVNQDIINDEIAGASNNVTVLIPPGTDKAEALFVLKNVYDMSGKGMSLTIKADSVQYSLPAAAVDTTAVLALLGASDPTLVPVGLVIATALDADALALANAALEKDGCTPVYPPIQITITAAYDGKTVEIAKFAQYVSVTFEVTAQQALIITTAAIIEPDGTIRHVPTEVYQQDGKWFAKANSLTNSTYALIYYQKIFLDVEGNPYETVINEMGSRKIISGVGDDLYGGERETTRAEFATIIIRALGLPSNGDGTVFTDVSTSKWYFGSVGKAYEYGLTVGVGGGEFEPERYITRQEAMVMIRKAAAIAGLTGGIGETNDFMDAGDMYEWALEAAKWCIGSGLFSGQDGMLHPTDTITRAETAALVLRLLQNARLVTDGIISRA